MPLSESDRSLAGELVEGKSFVEIGERQERSEDSVRRQRNAIRKTALARVEGLSEASELRDRIQRAMSKSESPEPSRSASSLFDHVAAPAFWHEIRADRRPLLIGEGA